LIIRNKARGIEFRARGNEQGEKDLNQLWKAGNGNGRGLDGKEFRWVEAKFEAPNKSCG
jgi:hypothetical protein